MFRPLSFSPLPDGGYVMSIGYSIPLEVYDRSPQHPIGGRGGTGIRTIARRMEKLTPGRQKPFRQQFSLDSKSENVVPAPEACVVTCKKWVCGVNNYILRFFGLRARPPRQVVMQAALSSSSSSSSASSLLASGVCKRGGGYANAWGCARGLVSEQGLRRGLFAGLAPTLLRDVPS